jgi:hypothetical protein
MFGESRTNAHDKEQSGHPSLITDDLKNRIDQHIRTNRRFTFDEIRKKFPQVSRSLIHEIVTDHLHHKEKKIVQDGFHGCSLKSTGVRVWVLLRRFWSVVTKRAVILLVATGDETLVTLNVSLRSGIILIHRQNP